MREDSQEFQPFAGISPRFCRTFTSPRIGPHRLPGCFPRESSSSPRRWRTEAGALLLERARRAGRRRRHQVEPDRFRLGRRPRRRGAARGTAGGRAARRRGARRGGRARRRAAPACAGCSTRWTAPPTSSTASRPGRSRGRARTPRGPRPGWYYDPGRDETFAAVRGGGARLNGGRSPSLTPTGRSGRWSAPASRTRAEARAVQARALAAILPRGARHPPRRVGGARPLLGGLRTPGRVLRGAAQALGLGCRRALVAEAGGRVSPLPAIDSCR